MTTATDQDARAARKAIERERVAGLLEGRPRVGPRTVHFDIANACNTRCTTCWHHSPHLAPERVPSAGWKRMRLGLERFREILDDLVALGGLEGIILSGMGEPTVNPAIYEMVRHAHAHGIAVTIITNLIGADVDALLDSDGRLDLLTSICGVTRDVWQAFHAHPRPDGFEQLIARLERLRERGFRPKHVEVINAQNVHELVDMVHFARRYPVKRINFKLASLQGGTEAVALSPAQKAELADDLVPRARAFAAAFGIDTDLDAFATQIHLDSHRTAPIEDVGCFMGFSYARIAVDGEVLFCCNTNTPVGHLERDAGARVSQLWTGEAWQARRDSVRAGRYFPGCEQCGKYKQNLKWSQKLREKLGDEALAGLIGRSEAP